MGRWQPGTRERLEQEALELFIEQGFEQTTVAGIAGRAGLTERTFFRHFSDKREVLFGGEQVLETEVLAGVRAAPATAPPLAAVADGFVASAESLFADRYEHARRRQRVIDANPELQERELLKLARLAEALAQELQARGAAEPLARLTAETGVALFKVAFGRWVGGDGRTALAEHLRAAFGELRAAA